MNTNETDKKSILIFSTAYYPFFGGAEVAIKEITDRLAADFEFDLITARMDKRLPKSEKIGVLTIYRIGFGYPIIDKLLLPFLGALKTWQLQKSRKYFCFWAIMVTFGSGAAYIFNLFSFSQKVPIVLTLQEGDSENHLHYKWAGLISLSWKMALKRSTAVTTLSTFLLERAKKYGYRGPSTIIPNGVDVANFSRVFSDEEKSQMKKFLAKKEDDIFLVTSGRLVKKNATDDIISSLQFLPKNISLIILGTGEEGFRLQALAKKKSLSDRVKFIGYISHKDMPRYFNACDIFVRPSRSEGFGNSFIEAMASRLPVIATPVGGITDFLSDKETGLFCSPDNPKSLAKAVIFMLENVDLKEKMIQNAYDMVTRRFSWDRIAERMNEEVFKHINR